MVWDDPEKPKKILNQGIYLKLWGPSDSYDLKYIYSVLESYWVLWGVSSLGPRELGDPVLGIRSTDRPAHSRDKPSDVAAGALSLEPYLGLSLPRVLWVLPIN